MKPDPLTQVLWVDDCLLAINKPAGLTTLPDGYDPHAPHVKSLFEPAFGPLWIVHRLDRFTSGVLLLARSAAAHRFLNDHFAKREVVKVYHAIVAGNPGWESKTVDLRLRSNADRRHRTIVDPRIGKPAQTDFHVLERFVNHALVEAVPKTGRTHQIRAHLAALQYPLVGDDLYGTVSVLLLSEIKPGFTGGKKSECALIQRLCLHAHSLTFAHPETHQELCIQAPYPKDFNAALRQLRRYSAPQGFH